mmetsp:Transcript_1511/g.2353  ORF Transcript_1511/g.2353 Transcript_1511/m.2353 type:complete len:342 (+) Transcript_1511:84-1109(+)
MASSLVRLEAAVAPRLTHRRRTFPYLDHCRRAVPHFVPSSPSAQPSLSASQRVVTRGVTQSTEPPACHDESDAADSITPGFGLGSPPWPRIHADLRGGTFGQVRTVTVEEARELLSEGGAALADVRPRIEFGEFRAGAAGDGSLDVRNVPYFVPHRSASKRWQGYFLCTKDGLKERDWRFTRSFEETFPDKSAPIVVGCKTGGDVSQDPITVDPVTNRRVVPDGSSQYTDKSRSNSLMAVYELQQAGYTNLYHLQGGVTKWCTDGEAHIGNPSTFYFHPTILPGVLFQLIMVEGIVVRSNLAYVKQFHPENFEQINSNNALYGAINDFVANSPINWMFDYY